MQSLNTVEMADQLAEVPPVRYWTAIMLNDPLVISIGEWDVRERGSMNETMDVVAACDRAITRPVGVVAGMVLADGTIVCVYGSIDRNYREDRDGTVRIWGWGRALEKIRGGFPPAAGKHKKVFDNVGELIARAYAVVIEDATAGYANQPREKDMKDLQLIEEIRNVLFNSYVMSSSTEPPSQVKLSDPKPLPDTKKEPTIVSVDCIAERFVKAGDARRAAEKPIVTDRAARPSDSAA
jgi:hypothetical protein